MEFGTVLQIVQTVSVLLAILVAGGTLRGRNDDKAIKLTKMQSDIEYIKKSIDCIPVQSNSIIELKGDMNRLNDRFDEHIRHCHSKEE